MKNHCTFNLNRNLEWKYTIAGGTAFPSQENDQVPFIHRNESFARIHGKQCFFCLPFKNEMLRFDAEFHFPQRWLTRPAICGIGTIKKRKPHKVAYHAFVHGKYTILSNVAFFGPLFSKLDAFLTSEAP